MNTISLIKNYYVTKNFNIIYDQYKPMILKLVKKYSLNEFENELFIKLWNIINNLKIDKFIDEKEINAYIYKSLNNQCIDIVRKIKKNNQKYLFNSDVLTIVTNLKKETLSLNTDIFFYDMIKNLNEVQYKIAVLKYKHLYTNSEISKIINKSRQTVYKNNLILLDKLSNINV